MAIYASDIDVGFIASRYTMLKDSKEVVSRSLVSVGTGTSGPQRVTEKILRNAGKTHESMNYTLTTDYGHNSLGGIADKQMGKLSYHAKDTFFLFPKMHIVIDIGGQDVKISEVEGGATVNLQMNDKCAAGTGRFPNVMARVLEVNIEDLEKLSAESTKRIGISSTCTALAESEVISRLAQDTDRRDIIAGIHRAIAGRVAGLVHRVGLVPDVVMTDGVTQNHDVAKALEKQLSCEVKTSPLTQYNGALDAALFAYQGALKHAKA